MLRRHFFAVPDLGARFRNPTTLLLLAYTAIFLRHVILVQYSAPTDVSGLGCSCLFSRLELRIDNQEQNDDIFMEDNGLVRPKLTAGGRSGSVWWQCWR